MIKLVEKLKPSSRELMKINFAKNRLESILENFDLEMKGSKNNKILLHFGSWRVGNSKCDADLDVTWIKKEKKSTNENQFENKSYLRELRKTLNKSKKTNPFCFK